VLLVVFEHGRTYTGEWLGELGEGWPVEVGRP
jgi:hypothetical protein